MKKHSWFYGIRFNYWYAKGERAIRNRDADMVRKCSEKLKEMYRQHYRIK